ncbi:Major facilitator superfamily MFS_1 [Burkholderia diffusa]|uniref:MFS transporter n=1 Tax=Burkholderia diffusa TaxID=488732 RepID=UPI001CB4200E|nr:MFS transporter [Burkholderia diffusa]CAG9250156.1 Major facilitator superfamily MFS_1 [Burkholderia diffusa]
MSFRWRHRYFVLLILFALYLLCYMDRMIMAAAIPFIAAEFHLSAMQMGGILSAFFFSYALCQIPAGLLADRFGPRLMSTIGITWWTIFTALTGLCNSLGLMLVVRVAFGVGEALFPPAAFKALSAWFPKRQLGRATGLMMTTNALGPALAPLFVAAVMAAWGWRAIFTSLFIPGIALATLGWLYVRNSPKDSKHVSEAELEEISDSEKASSVSSGKADFAGLLKTPLVWWCFITLFVFSIASWGIMSWFPTYLLKARGLSIARMGIMASVPFLVGTIAYCVTGFLSDKFFRNRRELLIVLGCIVAAVFAYLTAHAETAETAVFYQSIGYFFSTMAGCSLYTIPNVVLPNKVVGSAIGVVNAAGQLAGFLSPLIVGYILTMTNNDFNVVFHMFVGCFLVAAVSAWFINTNMGRGETEAQTVDTGVAAQSQTAG